ncbi:hypothetical protein NMY22_g8280 [Coprinellus aureogranulatus]|nr:hypothetical protein NMY22_g8280 [Coprinellus aureogranulatus]
MRNVNWRSARGVLLCVAISSSYPSAILTAGFVAALNSDSRLIAVFWWPASSSCSTTIDALKAGLAETSNSRPRAIDPGDAAASRSGSFPPPFRRIVSVSGTFSSSSLGSSPYRQSPFRLTSKLTLSIPSHMRQLPIAPQTPQNDHSISSTSIWPSIGVSTPYTLLLGTSKAHPTITQALPSSDPDQLPDLFHHLSTPLTVTHPRQARMEDGSRHFLTEEGYAAHIHPLRTSATRKLTCRPRQFGTNSTPRLQPSSTLVPLPDEYPSHSLSQNLNHQPTPPLAHP